MDSDHYDMVNHAAIALGEMEETLAKIAHALHGSGDERIKWSKLQVAIACMQDVRSSVNHALTVYESTVRG
jgi:hypothetical protein